MAKPQLYTPELLGLATRLADWPMLADAPFTGEARSPACGSTVTVSLRLSESGCIEALGLRAHACAVGQASAALFAAHAVGLAPHDIETALARIAAWLNLESALPAWPDLEAIAPAREYPARHGAILLPWKAALAALSTTSVAR